MKKIGMAIALSALVSTQALAAPKVSEVLGSYEGKDGNKTCSVDIVSGNEIVKDGEHYRYYPAVWILLKNDKGENFFKEFAVRYVEPQQIPYESLRYSPKDFQSILNMQDADGTVSFKTSNSSAINNGSMAGYKLVMKFDQTKMKSFEGQKSSKGFLGVKSKAKLICADLQKKLTDDNELASEK